MARALAHAQSLPSGGWYVLSASGSLRRRTRVPQRFLVDDVELVAWRSADRTVTVAPAACPHLGADLSGGTVDACGRLVCPWHGLALGPEGHAGARWRPFPSFDDGVLTWVQLDRDSPGATSRPILPERPAAAIDAVLQIEATCEPQDVIANRLDPWHGTHLHPYAFSTLDVVSATDAELVLDVSYRVTNRFRVPVRARFHCPEPRTIVMTILAGEGAGSVVETHATPLCGSRAGQRPRTAIIEATLATSERPGFAQARRAVRLVRPLLRTMAARLWRDDAAYAERRYALRAGLVAPWPRVERE